MSKKNKDLDFEEGLKVASRKELRKICRHFQQMNIMAVTENYHLSESVRALQDELAQAHINLEHKDRLLTSLVNS